jgi:hypothetical protein
VFYSSLRKVLLGAALASVALLPNTIKAGTETSAAGTTSPSRSSQQKLPARQPEPFYEVHAGLDGEIFPALASYVSFRRPPERPWGTVTVSIANGANTALANRVTVSIPGWSEQEIQMVDLAPGQSRTLLFAPTFLSRFFRNTEIVAASALVNATDLNGHLIYSATVPVRLRSADDMYWGRDFKYARFIASWVTPHDSRVEEVLKRAKEFMPARRLPGYESWKSPAKQAISTAAQAKAIYQAVQQTGLSYVKSSLTIGSLAHAEMSERVRMPDESLEHASANCIDGVVLYASLFENLGMEPVVVLVPGHSYIGVRVAEGASDYFYFDAALTGRVSFESSVESARRGMRRLQPKDVLRIDIADARAEGIFPMPSETTADRREYETSPDAQADSFKQAPSGVGDQQVQR